jgi:hypothetical protein
VLLAPVLGQSAQAPGAAQEGRCVMARSRSGLKQVQRDAYLISRTAGDLSAAQRGPAVLGRRLARRDLTRAFFRVLRQMSR